MGLLPSPLLSFEGVSFSYGDGRPALEGISFSLAAGERVAVIGPNGSGKSTLALLAAGLLRPRRGRVQVTAASCAAAGGPARAAVGIVFQNPDNQIVGGTAEEDAAFGPANLGLAPAEALGRARRALVAVGLAELADRAPAHLSGGEKQRLAVAGALALEPAFLVCDEATSMLDAASRRELWEVVAAQSRRRRLGVLWITHDPEEAARCERVLVLGGGRLVAAGPPERIFHDGGLLGRGLLEPPPAVRLAVRLRAGGLDLPPGILTAADLAEALAPVGAVAGPGTLLPEAAPAAAATPAGAGGPEGLVAEDLAYTYQAGTAQAVPALRGVGLTLAPGECVAVLGPSGAGKSTLLLHLKGLLRPAAGRVLVDGVDVAGHGPRAACARRRVGLLFQQPEDQLFAETVVQDVAFGPRSRGLPAAEANRRAAAALEAVGLDPAAVGDRSPFALSGGERRRVALAGVLACRPRYLALDEPGAGLDPAGRGELWRRLRRLKDEEGLGILLVTHDPEEAATLADRVLLLGRGRAAATGPAREVLARPALLAGLGLAPPFAVQVAACLARRGLEVGPCLSLEELAAGILARRGGAAGRRGA